MSNTGSFVDFSAADRYQMGTLHDAPGENTVWNLGDPVKLFQLRPISSPLTPTAKYTAIRIPCQKCSGRAEGGDLFVQFRDDQGYSGEVPGRFQNKAYVHLRYATKEVSGFKTITGKSTELLKVLSPQGPSYINEAFGLSIKLCQIAGGFADISISTTKNATVKACPNFNKTTMQLDIPPLPAWANRCSWVPMGKKMIKGYDWTRSFETFYDAQLECARDKRCVGIYQSKPGALFEWRDGGYKENTWITYDLQNGDAKNKFALQEGAQSWACHGFLPNGKMMTSSDGSTD